MANFQGPSSSDDLVEKLVGINRVAKVVKGGRQFGFTALTVVVTRSALGGLISKSSTLDEAVAQNQLTLDGDTGLLERLLDALEGTGTFFGVVEP